MMLTSRSPRLSRANRATAAERSGPPPAPPDHREQLSAIGQEPGDNLRADGGEIIADDHELTADRAQDVPRTATAGAGQRLLDGHRDGAVPSCRRGPAHRNQVVATASGRLEDGQRGDPLDGRAGADHMHLEACLGGC